VDSPNRAAHATSHPVYRRQDAPDFTTSSTDADAIAQPGVFHPPDAIPDVVHDASLPSNPHKVSRVISCWSGCAASACPGMADASRA